MERGASRAVGAGAGAAPALRFEGVSFRYPGATGSALSGVRLDVFPGEIVAVVGGNGSGKSTLARLANGLLQPVEGRVVVTGASAELCSSNPRDVWPVRAAVGLLFQDPDDQIVGATVEDDVAFGLENLGVPRAEMRERVATILEVVGLAAEAATEAHLLSGGQKQRLALAGVLVLRPSVLVLDEPTSMLDPAGRDEVLAFVERLASEGEAVLLITQHMEEALRADRLVALDAGGLVYSGTPRDFFVNGPHADLPLGVPHALELARDLETVFGPGCAGRWPVSDPPLSEQDLVTALALRPVARWDRILNAGGAAMQGVEEERDYAARLRGVSVTYNPGTSLQRPALQEVDLDVRAGLVTAVIGPTASGKTTLLQLVAGLLPPSRGDLTIWGRKAARPGQVGMVMQRAEMQLFCATVREDVAVAPRLAGLEGRALEMRVEDALLSVGLDPEAFGGRSPHALSLGEQRRVALAGILSLEPRLLVLDEPGAGLDPLMRRRLMERLLAWREEGGHTLLYASHDMEEVARVADHVVLLAGGRIVGCGPAAAVLGDEAILLGAGMRPPLAARVAAGIGGHGPLPVTGSGLAAWLEARGAKRGGRA